MSSVLCTSLLLVVSSVKQINKKRASQELPVVCIITFLFVCLFFSLMMYGYTKTHIEALPLGVENLVECLLFGALISATDPGKHLWASKVLPPPPPPPLSLSVSHSLACTQTHVCTHACTCILQSGRALLIPASLSF